MITINIKTITQGALAISLICVFFTLFKGFANILNALLVPLALYCSMINQKMKDSLWIYGALLAVCFMFFKMQIIFTFFYCLLAFLLSLLQKKKVPTGLSALILTVAVSFSFLISILLTDYIFLTHMSQITLRIFNGNRLIYGSVLLFEGALVGVGQLFISRMFYKRLQGSAF